MFSQIRDLGRRLNQALFGLYQPGKLSPRPLIIAALAGSQPIPLRPGQRLAGSYGTCTPCSLPAIALRKLSRVCRGETRAGLFYIAFLSYPRGRSPLVVSNHLRDCIYTGATAIGQHSEVEVRQLRARIIRSCPGLNTSSGIGGGGGGWLLLHTSSSIVEPLRKQSSSIWRI